MVDRFDDAFHSTARLQLAAFLSGCDEATFGAVMDGCALSKSTLSKSVRALEEVGYIAVRKGYYDRMPRTWLSLTPAGRQAITGHLAALSGLAQRAASISGDYLPQQPVAIRPRGRQTRSKTAARP